MKVFWVKIDNIVYFFTLIKNNIDPRNVRAHEITYKSMHARKRLIIYLYFSMKNECILANAKLIMPAPFLIILFFLHNETRLM
jgi:hypothetical protein